MIRKHSILALCLLVLMIISGCTKTPTNNNTDNQQPSSQKKTLSAVPKIGDYFPLKAGSTWTFQGKGNEYASFERQMEYVKNGFGQVREANGGTVTSSIYQVTDMALTRVYTKGESYDNTNILDGGFSANDNTVIIQAPLQKGKSWQSDDNLKREIVTLAAAVDTPAGQFKNCLHIRMSGPDNVINEYYAKGIGLVKREFITGGETISSSLEKYTIVK